jgi:Na+/H+ antiporter NhaD/arsenite permease-like protein
VFALAFSLKTKKNLFKGVDYHLLFTFAFFFFIIGNIARIPEVINFIQSTFVGPQMAFLGTVITSQFLSNIAAPILISPFTPHAVAVTLGADVGGVGTMVASMATLIAYKIIRVQARGETAGFIKYFAIVNAAFLVVLATIGVVIVSFITF